MTAIEQRADHDLHDDAGHVQETEAEGDEPHQERREDDAGNAAGAAEDRDAAEDDHGDHLELPADGDRGSRRAEPRRQAARGKARRSADRGEKDEAVAVDGDAGETAPRPGCGRWRRCAARPRSRAARAREERDGEEEHELEGERPGDVALAEKRKARRDSFL